MTSALASASPWRSLRFVRPVLLPGLPWLLVLLLPAWPVLALWLPVMIIHVLIPLIDGMLGADPAPPRHSDYVSELLPALCLPTWITGFLWAISVSTELAASSWLGLAISMGVIGGVVAINAAHELIHRTNPNERIAGAALLASVCYGAFKVEHVRGHHLWVGTDRDTASAVRGQSLYSFVPASIVGTVRNAWKIEKRRLQHDQLPVFSFANECLSLNLISLLWVAGVGLVFGPAAASFALLVSLIAIIELEFINYIEHYGLRRRVLADGRVEPVEARHSWNANSRVLNAFLFNLQRHSDHHAHAGKRYQALNAQVDAPMLPANYGAMILLALFPPWWFAVMNKRLDQLEPSEPGRPESEKLIPKP